MWCWVFKLGGQLAVLTQLVIKLPLIRLIRLLVIAQLVIALVGCVGGSKRASSDPAETLFQRATQYHQSKNYEEALNFYALVKNQHPYSAFATRAQLGIADVQYAQEAWPEAEALYKLFKEFHPKHPELDRVVFRIGMSVLRQLPPTVDRDLSLAPEALQHFQHVLTQYPKSSHLQKARENLQLVRGMLVQKEEQIAHFYFRRGEYLSAFNRYKALLGAETLPEALSTKMPKKLSETSQNAPSQKGVSQDSKILSTGALAQTSEPERTLFEAVLSAHKLKKHTQAQNYFKLLAKMYPQSSQKQKAQEVLGEAL